MILKIDLSNRMHIVNLITGCNWLRRTAGIPGKNKFKKMENSCRNFTSGSELLINRNKNM